MCNYLLSEVDKVCYVLIVSSLIFQMMNASTNQCVLFLISEVDKESYVYSRARREAFSSWLSSAASKKIKEEVQAAKFQVRN